MQDPDPLTDRQPKVGAIQDAPSPSVFENATEIEIDTNDEGMRALAASATVDGRVMEALRYAGAELRAGICESGDNGGVPYDRYVKWFGNYPRSPWCAFFISWCWDNATDRNRRTPWDNPGWVESVRGWAQQHGKLTGSPQTGDLFGVGGEHIGWVWSAQSGALVTIEGNASNCVKSYRRESSGLWFARIA